MPSNNFREHVKSTLGSAKSKTDPTNFMNGYSLHQLTERGERQTKGRRRRSQSNDPITIKY